MGPIATNTVNQQQQQHRGFGTAPHKNSSGKFKSLGSGFAKSIHKDISTAQCAAQSTATVAKHMAEEVASSASHLRGSTLPNGGTTGDNAPTLGRSVAASAAGMAAFTIPNRCVTTTSAKFVPAMLVNNLHPGSAVAASRESAANHREHCLLGWTPDQIYSVVADVQNYSAFLPWCVSSSVESSTETQVPLADFMTGSQLVDKEQQQKTVAVVEMKATLGVGFSFLRESYSSHVHLQPGHLIQATLFGKSTLLRELRCTWSFDPIESTDHLLMAMCNSSGNGHSSAMSSSHSNQLASFVRDRQLDTAAEVIAALKQGEQDGGGVSSSSQSSHSRQQLISHAEAVMRKATNVHFEVGFDFRSALHQSMSSMVMSNVVTVMTKSFESRCLELYGPPSMLRKGLPLETGTSSGSANAASNSATATNGSGGQH